MPESGQDSRTLPEQWQRQRLNGHVESLEIGLIKKITEHHFAHSTPPTKRSETLPFPAGAKGTNSKLWMENRSGSSIFIKSAAERPCPLQQQARPGGAPVCSFVFRGHSAGGCQAMTGQPSFQGSHQSSGTLETEFRSPVCPCKKMKCALEADTLYADVYPYTWSCGMSGMRPDLRLGTTRSPTLKTSRGPSWLKIPCPEP